MAIDNEAHEKPLAVFTYNRCFLAIIEGHHVLRWNGGYYKIEMFHSKPIDADPSSQRNTRKQKRSPMSQLYLQVLRGEFSEQ